MRMITELLNRIKEMHPDTAQTVEELYKHYDELYRENQECSYALEAAATDEVLFTEWDGTERVLRWDRGDDSAGIPGGYVPEDEFVDAVLYSRACRNMERYKYFAHIQREALLQVASMIDRNKCPVPKNVYLNVSNCHICRNSTKLEDGHSFYSGGGKLCDKAIARKMLHEAAKKEVVCDGKVV